MKVDASSALLLLVLCAAAIVTARAAHSRRRPTGVSRQAEPRYDRSITTFSANGRLQQIEYGMEASKRGETIAAFCNGEDAVVVTVASSSKVYRLDDHVYLFTCGLVGDGRALASELRIQCQRFRLSNGQAPTIRDVARAAAQIQHDLTRTGGRRPLGLTAMVVGIDDTPKHQPRLFQSDPGGILEECRYCAAGKGRSQALESLKDLEAKLSHSDNDTDEPAENATLDYLAHEMAMVGIKTSSSLLQENKEEENPKTVDVWIFRSNDMCRGKTQATCIRNVAAENTDELHELF